MRRSKIPNTAWRRVMSEADVKRMVRGYGLLVCARCGLMGKEDQIKNGLCADCLAGLSEEQKRRLGIKPEAAPVDPPEQGRLLDSPPAEITPKRRGASTTPWK